MQKGLRFRIYPTRKQISLIEQTFGCCRLVYNKGLDMRISAYENGTPVGYNQTAAMVTELKQKEEYAFLKAVDSIALQQTLRDLDKAYANFFAKRAGFPVFKSKHHNHQSYRTQNQGDNIRIVGKYLKLPKLGLVKVKQSCEAGTIKNVTLERTPTGKYFAVLCVEYEPVPRQNQGGSIGIDMGISHFYTDSEGRVVENPKYLERAMQRLVREQVKLSRKQKGSKNRERQRRRVARLHEKVANQRNDFLQKQSTRLIYENQVICIEDLSVRNMVRNHRLAQHIASASWSKFFGMLEYKALWYGNDIRRIAARYPSSQTCSACGFINPVVKDLSVRTWVCPRCGAIHERDENAAKNIKLEGLRMQVA